MNPAYRPERGYVSIPVLGAVGASYGTNGIAVDNFIYPKNGETVTFMDNSVNTESFLNGLKDENQVNMDFGTQVLSGGWYAGKDSGRLMFLSRAWRIFVLRRHCSSS